VPVIETDSPQTTDNICDEEILEESNESEPSGFQSSVEYNSLENNFYRFFNNNFSISSDFVATILLVVMTVFALISGINENVVISRRKEIKENLMSAYKQQNS
jgi:hypothetical protein